MLVSTVLLDAREMGMCNKGEVEMNNCVKGVFCVFVLFVDNVGDSSCADSLGDGGRTKETDGG